MSKAYHRVEWFILDKMMEKMGFLASWRVFKMKCVSIVSYSIVINGYPILVFYPSKGFRQGDPLSPYLFFICEKDLSTIIRKAESKGDIHEVKVCRQAPSISHLFFTYDSILFSKALIQKSKTLKHIFHSYEITSGQKINFKKSTITFSRNSHQYMSSHIQTILGVRRMDHHDRYLGLPTIIGKSKRQIFSRVRDNVWQKLKS